MRQNSKRNGFGNGVPTRKVSSVASLNAERRRSEEMYKDEIAAFYAAHPEFAKQR